MNNLAENIKRVLANEAHLAMTQAQHSNEEYFVLVEETKENATLKGVKITNLRSSDFCFTLDIDEPHKFNTYSAYIDSSHKDGYDQRCDFVIMRYEHDKWHVYFGDLKSTTVVTKEILTKLRASQLFFDYLLSISSFAKNWKETDCKPIDYEAHYLVIHKDSSKNSTNRGNTSAKLSRSIECLKLYKYPLSTTQYGKAKIKFDDIETPKLSKTPRY